MIVLNESEWAKKMIDERSLGKRAFDTLIRVARYYMEVEGASKKEARMLLDEFVAECDSSISLVKWSHTLDRAVRTAAKFKSVNIDKITVTESEMEVINGLKGRQIQKLLFALLCVAKYWMAVNPELNGWVSTPPNEIMKMANLNISADRRSRLLGYLKDAGLIAFPASYDNTNIRVTFVDDGSPAALEITDFRNLGNQFMMYCGENYIVCERCGLVVKERCHGKGAHQRFCPDCAIGGAIQSKVNRVMRPDLAEDPDAEVVEVKVNFSLKNVEITV